MALPPTIPTSFVPKQPVAPSARKRVSGTNPFLTLSYFILAVTVAGCAAVFGYQYYLQGAAKKKANDVIVAQNKIDQTTVTEFIHLRDRFTAAKDLLNHQVSLSQFFDVLEQLTLQSVNYTTLRLVVGDDRHATVELAGTARSFNALAAQSAALANEKRIKRAIFSNISVNQNNLVTFTLTAELDPTLVERSASVRAPAPAPVQAVPASQASTTPVAAQKPAGATSTKP